MKSLFNALFLSSFLILAGCAVSTTNALISVPSTPVSAGPPVPLTKKGESVCHNVLGIIAWGDCTIETAKKAGGITTAGQVNQDNFGILGIYYKTTTVVTGS
ncbi:MAG: TRL-like family protein [Desulfovibrionaceae bacterium]